MKSKLEINHHPVIQELKTRLNDLFPCTNNVASKIRNEELSKVQQFLNRNVAADCVSDELLAELNQYIKEKNFCLVRNGDKISIQNKDTAFKETYAERYKTYVNHTNDKVVGNKALLKAFRQLTTLNTFNQAPEISLLDIGSGDGSTALPVVTHLKQQSSNFSYLAVDNKEQYRASITHTFDDAKIPYELLIHDFREIKEILSQRKRSIALASHLYTSTNMNEFFPMVWSFLKEDGFLVMAQETEEGDAKKFRINYEGLTPYALRVRDSIAKSGLNSITIPYVSCLTFPTVKEDHWNELKNIKQADFGNTYSSFSEELKIIKNLIEFVLSDRLEAFTEEDLSGILDKIKAHLETNNNQFNSPCEIQIILSANHTLECKQEFLALKEKMKTLSVLVSSSNISFLSPKMEKKETEIERKVLSLG